MAYGNLKADNLVYSTPTGDVVFPISGAAYAGAPLISGVSGVFTTSVSGATITGGSVLATTITGSSISGANITGVSGTFTASVSGATVTGNTVLATTITGISISGANITGVSGTFTDRISGTTVTGTSGQFTTITAVTGIFTTTLSGATVTGNTAQFTNLTGTSAGFTTVTGTTVTGQNIGVGSGITFPDATVQTTAAAANGATTTGVQTFTAAQRGAVVVIPYATGISINLASGNNYQITLTGNTTLQNPTNIVSGQAGVITIIQGTSGNTMAFATGWQYPGGSGSVPTLTATSGAVDLLVYYTKDTSSVAYRLVQNVKA